MNIIVFDEDSVRSFTREFELLFDRGDAAAMTAFYAEDAQIVTEGMAPVRGSSAIREFWREAIAFAAAARARRTIRLVEATNSAELGYAICTVDVVIPGARPADESRTVSSWDTTVWRRGAAGAWEMVVDISAHIPVPTPS